MGGGAHRHATQHGVHEVAQPCRSCRLFHCWRHVTPVAYAAYLRRVGNAPLCPEALSLLPAHLATRCGVLRPRCPLRLTAVPPAACCCNAPLASSQPPPRPSHPAVASAAHYNVPSTPAAAAKQCGLLLVLFYSSAARITLISLLVCEKNQCIGAVRGVCCIYQ
jgi:hypothetical protein